MADLGYIDRTAETKIVGQDSTGNSVFYVSADANGNMLVKDYSNGPVTAGTAATVSSLIGGQFNTSLPTLTNTQQSAIQLDSSGRLIIRPLTSADVVSAVQSGTWTVQPGNTANTTPWLVTDSSDGPVTPGAVAAKSSLAGGQFNTVLPTLTNGQQSAMQLDSSGRLIVTSNGTAVGVADESVFVYGNTIQQVIGGVYQDTSPTLTAGQQGAVRLTQYRGQHANLRNSGGVEITSDSPGTAGNQRLHHAVPDTTVATVALSTLNAVVSITMAGMSSVGFQLSAGTLIGTITPECSVDGGTTWVGCTFFDPANSAVYSNLAFGSPNTLKVLSILPIGGSSNVRVRVSAYTSGTANALLRASVVTGAAGAITAAAFGTVNNMAVALSGNTPTLLLAANPNRKYAYFSNVGGATLNIQFGTSTGLSATVGLIITSKSFYELKGDNLYTGPVYGFYASNQTVSVTEGTP